MLICASMAYSVGKCETESGLSVLHYELQANQLGITFLSSPYSTRIGELPGIMHYAL